MKTMKMSMKTKKNIENENENENQPKKTNKGFTTEEIITKNLNDLCQEQNEYVKVEKNHRKLKRKTFFRIFKSSTLIGFSLTNTLVGAGILSFSQSCTKMGIIGYTLWTILTSYIS